MEQQKYRPDIDGLRAIAIILVVAFHAFPSSIPGGFVGVDVFFVISGFLISGLIIHDLEKGTFSFPTFYARRIRRLFPALLAVFSAVLLLGWLFLFPSEFLLLGTHVLASAGFSLNIVLWREVGYFDPASELKPLLHLWSLGVEEQFYLIFPPLLLGLWKQRRRLMFWLGAVAIATFFVNLGLTRRFPPAAFYLPVPRMWEFLAGSLLAYTTAAHARNRDGWLDWPPPSSLTSFAGTALLVAGAALIDQARAFPGGWALLPTLGAALIIAAGPQAWLNRHVFGSRPMVLLGKISYPLYLWHWPLLSFLNIGSSEPPAASWRAGAVAMAASLALLTYLLIERPVRRQRMRAPLIIHLAGAMVLLAAAGWAIQGELIRPRIGTAADVMPIVRAFDDWDYPDHDAFIKGKADGIVLMVGDSFMEQYYPRFKRLAESSSDAYSVRFGGVGGCPPLPDISRIAAPNGCIGDNQRAYADALKPEVKRVVFGSAWHYFYPIAQSNKEMAPDRFEHDAMTYVTNDGSRRPIRADSPAFLETFRKFQSIVAGIRNAGKEVYLVLPTPISDELDPRRMIDRWDSRIKRPQGILKAEYLAANMPVITQLRRIAAETGAVIIDPSSELCDATQCPAMAGKDPIYKDIGHIRPYFVRDHITVFDRVVRR